MRIAFIPLDSRPAHWQFPQRLAAIAGVELVMPPRGELGTLHGAADGLRLAQWLSNAVTGKDGGSGCEAAVFAWDTLIYGGLVQSRMQDVTINTVAEISPLLRSIDWRRVAGYAYFTIPRLGISIDSARAYATHQAVREYFILAAKLEPDANEIQRLEQLTLELSPSLVRTLWAWRERNHSLSAAALELSFSMGLRIIHAAMEDNATSGPHLREAVALMSLAEQQRRTLLAAGEQAARFSCFDGADECSCLLLARAIADSRAAERQPVQLIVHPKVPGPDRYTGLYESHSLGDGLSFLADFLGFNYVYAEAPLRWLIVHGVQPQPDLYESDARKVFTNPYLLPRELQGTEPLVVSDLAACNGANPFLIEHLAELPESHPHALIGFNTNFNTLGVSAAVVSALGRGAAASPLRRFLLERLADDVIYQSLARRQVVQSLREMQLDPQGFADINLYQLTHLKNIVATTWRQWCYSRGDAVLAACGIPLAQAEAVRFEFPWLRAFEIEAVAPA